MPAVPGVRSKGRCASRVGSPGYLRPRLLILPQASVSLFALPVPSGERARLLSLSVPPMRCRSSCLL
ncbi:hypothetical protein NDU88_006934 [Pleurodeles waltl]|uniref:Uncharacterized protein n=1 Tax=Pleurodeles waltl TaxID=8319 RepID=A0AAV7RRP4_PLEWA|nr:hypothetical protein NDU88_006934 [Pleurodeles waltl]